MSDRDRAGEPADVLLIEDDSDDVRLVREAFERGGVDATLQVVTDGSEALEYLDRRGEHANAPVPDLVVMNLDLPGKSGVDILREMDRDPRLARIPVVVLTSSDDEEDVRRSYGLQANAYLTKPVDPDAFLETIRSFASFWLETVRLPPGGGER